MPWNVKNPANPKPEKDSNTLSVNFVPGAATAVRKSPEPTDSSRHGFSCNAILFNCSCHSFDEVERQLIKAIHCSLAQARKFSWEVHNAGKAVVYTGPRERCEAVAYVLEDIGLIVRVSE